MSDPVRLPLIVKDFDPDALCLYCSEPVGAQSMDGPLVCPWCDMGKHRDGTLWTALEFLEFRECFALNARNAVDEGRARELDAPQAEAR